MKKYISVLLIISIVISLFTFPVYAKKDGEHGNKHYNDKKTRIEDLRERLEKEHKNKVVRKQLIKQIVAERKAMKDNSIPVFVNGKELKFDVPPVIKHGRMLIPVRAVTNALGAQVQWDGAMHTVTISKNSIIIIITLGNNMATVNGTQVLLDVSAELVNNRTLVPIRFIAQIFNNEVEWDPDTGSVIIEDDDSSSADDTDNDASTTPDSITVDTNTDSTEGDNTTTTED